MFKKQHTTKPNCHLLSNSAKKKIKNAHSLAHAYTHTHQQITIYYDQQQQPIYFATNSSNLLVPTIYTLLNEPNLLPLIRTNQHVLDKLTQGADLMLPGLIKAELLPLSHLKKDQLVAIAGHQPNDLIWAVGYLAEDVSLLLQADSGKAVITLHTQNDSLWNAGNKQIPTTVPLQPLIDTQEPSPSAPALVEKPVQSPDATDKPPSIHVDQFLLSALLITLWKKGHTLQSLLPMPASLFYSDHILPARPLECPKAVGVKDSSAKNLAKWLKQMQKKGLLNIKEDRKGGETLITSLKWDHPEEPSWCHRLETFVKFRTIADQEKMEAKAQRGDEAGDDAAAEKPPSSYAASWNLPKTTLIELFRAKKDPAAVAAWMDMVDLEVIFGDSPEGLHTRQTIKDALIKYLDAQVPAPAYGSKPVNRALVVPDSSLTAVMGLPDLASEPLSRADLLDTLLDRAFNHWKGEMPTIVLKKKKRAGPKHATLIAAHPLPPDHPTAKALASKDLRDKLAAHLGPGPPRPSPLELECQGDQRSFLQNLLTQSFHIHKSLISVL
ncbi:hypothetical protein VP01_1448g2 [Puccinia sorghi]|uniref:SUI1 domain-containing protein n=1 Tax=Puccinia sorghi TaxID=27349 RepID=A0A0L6VLY7_9BASI|nr:hypothetical protein VP01_1448g2 [Puccinia sorghi]